MWKVINNEKSDSFTHLKEAYFGSAYRHGPGVIWGERSRLPGRVKLAYEEQFIIADQILKESDYVQISLPD